MCGLSKENISADYMVKGYHKIKRDKVQYLSVLSVDGSWSPWGIWSSCGATYCGEGQKSRNRTCSDPQPLLNGKPCAGQSGEKKNCRMGACNKGEQLSISFPCLEYFLNNRSQVFFTRTHLKLVQN